MLQGKRINMGHTQQKRNPKMCRRCRELFIPTGANCKRCPPCGRANHLERCRQRHHDSYKKKGYNQKGENNNAWKGGVSPSYYQQVAFEAHGRSCARCGREAILVHHKDENRTNSNPDNLEVLCKRCHQVGHDCASNLPDVVVFREKSCDRCGVGFLPTGPRSKYCKSCGGKGVKG